MAPAAHALARLRIFQHGVLAVDLVLDLEVVGVGRRPVEIQSRANVTVCHFDPSPRYRCNDSSHEEANLAISREFR